MDLFPLELGKWSDPLVDIAYLLLGLELQLSHPEGIML